MRNRFVLPFFLLTLVFLPIACNQKSDDRAKGENTDKPVNNTGNSNALGGSLINSKAGVFVTFKPDSSGNTASRLLTITDAAGGEKQTYLCEDSLLNCDLFEKAKSVTTSNCDSNNNCSAPTEVESIPTCTKESGFAGNINQKMNEIAAQIYTLEEAKREWAEKFIAYNKETHGQLENKETDVATQIEAISKMHPCDILAEGKAFIDALAELNLNGEVDPEMIAGLVVGTLGASAIAVATGVITLQELRKGKSPEQFLKILQEAQDTAKTNLAKAKADLEKLQADKVAKIETHTKAKSALEEAKSNFKFTDDVLNLVEFKFKEIRIETEKNANIFKKLAKLSETDFNNLTDEEKAFLNKLIGETDTPTFANLKKLQTDMQKAIKEYKTSVQNKLTDLKTTSSSSDEITKLEKAGVKTKTEWEDLKKNNNIAEKALSDFAKQEPALKAKQLEAKIDLELTTAVNDLDKYNKFLEELQKIKDGNQADFKKVVSDLFGENSEFYQLIRDSKNSTLITQSIERLTTRIQEAKNATLNKVKGTVDALSDMAKTIANTTKQGINIAKSFKAGLVGGEEEEKQLTPDQKVIAEYVLNAADFSEELAKIFATQDTLEAQIAALLSQSFQASTPTSPSNPQ